MFASEIKPHEFQSIAEGLRDGQKVRTQHHCGDGDCLIVSRDRKGYSAYCFRCGGKGFVSLSLSLAERIENLRSANVADAEAKHALTLPTPKVLDPQTWPRYARVWMYKSGFSNDDITTLGFYYHERLDRVVMPVYDGDKLVYWQARGFTADRPKYINPSIDRQKLVAKYGAGGPAVVLTEDNLSAYKVGKVCEAWSLMGTTLTDSVLADLITKGKPVLIMLDPDAGGTKGLLGMARRLGAVGLKFVDARMTRDPKRHTLQEISEWITLKSSRCGS